MGSIDRGELLIFKRQREPQGPWRAELIIGFGDIVFSRIIAEAAETAGQYGLIRNVTTPERELPGLPVQTDG